MNDPKDDIAATIKKLDEIIAVAMDEYMVGSNAQVRAKFLSVAVKALSNKTRLLDNLGH